MISANATSASHSSPRALDEQIGSAFEILQYNQNLVQFADGKANTLILINSIALASSFGLTAAIPPQWHQAAVGLRIAFVLVSVTSVALSLAVVMSRIQYPEGVRRRDVVFFGDIMARPTPLSYRNDYSRLDPATFLGDLLERNYRTATIASRKYRLYGTAQTATVIACALWMLYIVFLQVFI